MEDIHIINQKGFVHHADMETPQKLENIVGINVHIVQKIKFFVKWGINKE